MTIQQTSLEAYREVQQTTMGPRQYEIYYFIKKYGPCTDKFVSLAASLPINCVTGRRNELMKAGLVVEDYVAPCTITNRKAKHWRINQEGRPPNGD